jgi:hypothetical protein
MNVCHPHPPPPPPPSIAAVPFTYLLIFLVFVKFGNIYCVLSTCTSVCVQLRGQGTARQRGVDARRTADIRECMIRYTKYFYIYLRLERYVAQPSLLQGYIGISYSYLLSCLSNRLYIHCLVGAIGSPPPRPQHCQ